MTHARRIGAFVLTAASIVLFTGCGTTPDLYADLQGEQDSQDELPQLEDDAYESVDVASSRYIGEHDGTSIWLAQGLEESSLCLVADAGEQWVVGCSGGGPLNVGGVVGEFEVLPDGMPTPEGATKLSDNVYAW
ncbi:hypothetical protein OED01_13640 [Microbacterium sp. M28]|uniref:hypothetical protein n=1 Tax=Microbacterium sp. M28 TaxID=2962064 RepID=UPI0021F4E417|nr:hypothetical protein [Microbacterium sp. M28]UYO96633.1 hypothetical protein OED01_13640 [Microbacterium sp. M28]